MTSRSSHLPAAVPLGFRSGVSLIELLISASLMTIVVGILGVVTNAVHMAAEYGQTHGAAVQHARVAIDRIARRVRQATANADYPGAWIVADTVLSWQFPDTLVVWNPDGEAVDPDGVPRVNELVVYRPNPSQPNELWELTDPSNSSTAPAIADASAWATLINQMSSSSSAEVAVLTDLLNTANVPQGAGTSDRACLRFHARVLPSAAQWDQYESGSIDWEDLDWAQSIYGSQVGLRQSWISIELQLVPRASVNEHISDDLDPLAFFGSAALYYQLQRTP